MILQIVYGRSLCNMIEGIQVSQKTGKEIEIERIMYGIKHKLKLAEGAKEGNVQDDQIMYLENNYRLFLQYIDNLIKEPYYQEDKFLTINIMIDYTKTVTEYDNLAVILRKARENNINTNRQTKPDKKLVKMGEDEYKLALVNLLSYTKKTMDRYNLVSEHYRREQNNLRNLGLSFLISKDESEIDKEFDINRLKNNSEVELLVKNLFWVNKLAKQIVSNQIIMSLAESENIDLNNKRLDEISDEKKYIALKKREIIAKVFELFDKYHNVNEGGIAITNFLTYYDYQRNPEGYLDTIESSIVEEIEKRIEDGRKTNHDLIKNFKEIESEYNYVFETDSEHDFVMDCITNNNQIIAIKHLYLLKKILEVDLLSALLKDQKNASRQYTSWGIVEDKKRHSTENTNILIVDLPGYLRSLQIHVNNDVMELFSKNFKIPQYTGIYQEKFSSNALFKPRSENAKKLKEIATKQKGSGKNEILIRHMSAVVNDEFHKIPQIENMDISRN